MKTSKTVLTLLAGAGIAQCVVMSASAAEPSGDVILQEVLVTASKRAAASVQDVPYNISAVSGLQLEKAGVGDLDDFSRIVPGLSTVDSGPNNKQIVIRGLAASAGTEQVGVYYDEIPASGRGGTNVAHSDVRLYDVERVEVLRGPQGTLYGAGSQAGTIRYIMNKPQADQFEAALEGSMGMRARDAGEKMSFDGMINVPVVQDKLAVRAVGYYREADGVVDVPALGIDGADREETYGGRVLTQLDISDATKLSFAVYYQDTRLDDAALMLQRADTRPGAVLTPFEDELKMYNLTFEHDLGWGTLTATGSRFERDAYYTFDVSQFVPGSGRVNQPSTTESNSGEVRFASDFDGPLQMVAGVYYNERQREADSFGAFIDESTGELPPHENRFFHTHSVLEFSDQALFGEVSYEVTDRLTLTGGARVFELERDVDTTLLIDLFGNPLGPEPHRHSKVSDSVYRFQASYELSDDALVYVTYSEGFREGGENAANLIGDIPRTYEPDFVNNYEVGWKSELLDRQLVLNGALYYMEWDGIQVSDLDDTGAFAYTSNAGAAELYGVEIEGSVRPRALSGFTATFGMRYSEQQLTQDNPNAEAGDPLAGRKGDPIPNSFRWQANAGLEQRFALSRWDAYARIDASYTGKADTTFSPADPQWRQWGDFVLTDLRVGVDEDRWSASIFVRNVFNERAVVAWTVQEIPGLPDLIRTTQPREIGIQYGWRF